MWRWTVLLCLIFYGHTSSQPVTNDDENARQTRQLDFVECCPCPSPGHGFAAEENSMSNGDTVFARARDIDDLPCRPRSSDSVGASSIFLPTSMRSEGTYVRPSDKKEDLKPLLHPEVDLASSVLQTLREATDEEYQDALARDATRNMAKETEESIFGDTLPEASNGNIVTIIVKPKHGDSLDEDTPQETYVQESHGVHAPIESISTNLGEMQVAQKPPSLLRDIFGLPRISKPAGLLHNTDNGASNVQERVIHVDNDQVTNKSELGLRKYAPFMKLDKNLRDKSSMDMKSNVVVDTSVKKVPDFKLPSMKSNVDTSVKKVPDFKLPAMKNKLKDLVSNRAVLESKDKTNSLPLIPKMRLNNPLLKFKGKNEEDLSLSPSDIHQKAKKSFFQTKSDLENIFQNTRPVGLKTLLKLKDVEFVPLKDLVPKSADRPTPDRPKLAWLDIFKKQDTSRDISSTKDKNTINGARSTEIIKKIPIFFDAEVSPSNVIEQKYDENCNEGAFKTTKIDDEDTEAKIASTEIVDTALSPSEIEDIVSDMSNEFANSQSNELPENTDDCNIKTLPATETNLPQSIESSFESEAQNKNEDELNFETSKESIPVDAKAENDPESELVSNEEDFVSNTNDADSITDSSNNKNDVLIPNDTVLEHVDNSLVNENTVTEEDCSQELPVSDHSKTFDVNPSKLIKPLSLDETLSSIKEKIAKHIENLKNPKTSSKSSKILDSPTSRNIIEDKESSPVANEKADSDCQNEEPIQVTTVKSDIYNDDLKIENESDNDKVSMQDLQKISDEMLQEEQKRESKALNCNEPTQEVIDPKELIEVNSAENGNTDSEQSANTPNDVIMDPQNIVDIAKHIKNLKNPKTSSKSSNILDSPTSSNNIESEESSLMADENVDSDCYNEESIQVTTVKPDICNNDLKIESESDDDKVSMQDLQKISDEMLQKEQERESKTLNCYEPTQEVTEPIEVNSAENRNTDSEQSANTQNDVIMDPQNHVVIVSENDNDLKNTCKSDLTLPKRLFEQESDANVEASEVVINRAPQSDNVFTSPLLLNKVLQPNKNDFSLNIPIPDLQDIKLPPLPTLDDIKLSFNNLFDKPERDVEGHSASEAASMMDTSNILAPIMSTDASAKHFQSILPSLRLEDIDLDILQLTPQSNLFSKIPKLDLHSFRTKLPLPTDLRLKPLKLQSAFEDKGGLLSLGQYNPWEIIPGLDDFGTRVKANTKKIAKTLRKPDTLRHSLKSSQRIGDLSDTKHSLKSMQHTIESKLRGATIKPVNLQSNDLFEAISRNHEDVNDKLRALHIDFNDRLETMRNNLFDMSIFGSGESRSTKSFTTFSNKNKDKILSRKTSQPQSLPSRKESKKTFTPQRLEHQKETRIGSSRGLQNKFKMPTAASVQVPRTIEVPELKATLTKSPGLGIQRASGVNPIFQNIEASQPNESTLTLWRQGSKKLPITNTKLGKTINPFKDSKMKVSFSTTPRPSLSTKLQSRKLSTPSSLSLTSNLGKNTGRLGERQDHKGSPSEMKHLIVSAPISSHLDQNNLENYGLESESRQTGAISTWKLGGRENVEQPKVSKDLESWPQVSESAFLSKVKEAVKARMLKVNSPITFKRADTQSVSSSRGDNGGVLNSNTDMARSASTNIDVIDGKPLKENVSYKCTMVCTKE